jgi:glycosyltransferase involved in cell wall biosynthesis
VTVGFHSPLPPVRSGVADYAQSLLEALRRRVEVRVGADRADVDLYHIGNNRLHAEVHARALARPGVVVLHDAVLHHFFLGALTRDQYIEEFAYNYGGWLRETAAELWDRRGHSAIAPEYFRYPMLRRVAETARAVIVHNPEAARIVREHAPAANVFEVPHLFSSEVTPPAARGRVFGVLGYLRETKRLTTALRAFARVQRHYPDTRLIVAGDYASRDLEHAVKPLLAAPGVIRRSWLTPSEFRSTAAGLTACINLRYPTAGETSGISIRLMGIGRCVVLSDTESNSRYPEAACVRVDTGPAERDMLEHALIWLCAAPDAAREIGVRAAEHVREHHSLDRAADEYVRVLNAACE